MTNIVSSDITRIRPGTGAVVRHAHGNCVDYIFIIISICGKMDQRSWLPASPDGYDGVFLSDKKKYQLSYIFYIQVFPIV